MTSKPSLPQFFFSGRIKIPLKREAWSNFIKTLERERNNFLHAPQAIAQLDEVIRFTGDAAPAAHTPLRIGPTHPIGSGFISYFPIYSSLLGYGTQALPGYVHVLQRVVIQWLTGELTTEPKAVIKVLGQELEPDQSPNAQLLALLTESPVPASPSLLNEATEPYPSAFREALAALEPANARDELPSELKQYEARATKTGSQRSYFEPFTPLDDGEDKDDLLDHADWHPQGTRVPAADYRQLMRTPAERAESGTTLEGFEAEIQEARAWQRFSGPLLFGTDQSLNPAVAAALLSKLWGDFQQLLASDNEDAAVPFCLSLSGILGRPFTVALKALFYYVEDVEPDKADCLQLQRNGFRTRIPNEASLAGVNEQFHEACNPWALLPLPSHFLDALEQLKRNKAVKRLFSLGLKKVRARAEAYGETALSPTFTQYSQERLSQTLAVLIFHDGFELCDAQIITGQDLGHSRGPLAYYCTTLGSLVRKYVAAMKQLLSGHPPIEVNAVLANELVGSPRAAINPEAAKTAFEELRNRIKAAGQNLKSLKRKIEYFNLVSAYTLLVIALSTGHRLTYRLSHLTLRSFLKPEEFEFAFAVYGDKNSSNGLSVRPSVVPPQGVQQLRHLMDVLAGLISSLTATPSSPAQRRLTKSLEKILSGDDPVFQWIGVDEEDYKVNPFDRSSLAAFIPGWNAPIETLRHFASMNMARMGFTSEDRRKQLAHTIDGEPFGPGDPDSPVRFAKRVSDPLGTILESLGLTPLYNSPLPDALITLEPLTVTGILASERALNRDYANSPADARRRVLASLRKHGANIESDFFSEAALLLSQSGISVSGQELSMATGVELSDEQLDEISESVVAKYPDVNDIVAVGFALSTLIHRLVDRKGWKCPLPMKPHLVSGHRPHITRASIEGARLLQRVQLNLESASQALPSIASNAILWCIVDSGLVTLPLITAVLRGLDSLVLHPFDSDSIVVDAQFRASDYSPSPNIEAWTEAVTVTGVGAVALGALSRSGWNPSETAIRDSFETAAQQLKSLLNSPKEIKLEDFLEISALAHRLNRIGLVAAVHDGRTPQHSLPLDRVIDVVHGRVRQRHLAPKPLPERTTIPRNDLQSGINTEVANAALRFRTKVGIRETVKIDDGVRWARGKGAEVFLKNHLPTWNSCGSGQVFYHYAERELSSILNASNKGAIRGNLSSFYSHLCITLVPWFYILKGTDPLTVGEDELTQIVVDVLSLKTPTTFVRALSTLREFSRSILKLGGAGVDWNVVAEEFDHPTILSLPYLVTRQELDWAEQQLVIWTRSARKPEVGEATAHPAYFRSSQFILNLSSDAGLRRNEGIGMPARHYLSSHTPPEALVAATYHRGLKRPWSRRPFNPLRTLGPKRHARLARHQADMVALQQGETRNLPYLFPDPSQPASVIGENLAGELIKAALAPVAPADSSHPHAGRHYFANSDSLFAAPADLRQQLVQLKGLSKGYRVSEVQEMPRFLRLYQTASDLGQSGPRTLCSTYMHWGHLIPSTDRRSIVNLATLRGLSCPAGILSSAQNRSLQISEILPKLGLASFPDFDPQPLTSRVAIPRLPSGSLRELNLYTLGEIVWNLAKAKPVQLVAPTHGLSTALCQKILSLTLRLQARHNYPLIVVDEAGNPTRGTGTRLWNSTLRLPRRKKTLHVLLNAVLFRQENEKAYTTVLRAISEGDFNGKIFTHRQHDVAALKAFLVACFPKNVRIMQGDSRSGWTLEVEMLEAAGSVKGHLRAPIAFLCLVMMLEARLANA